MKRISWLYGHPRPKLCVYGRLWPTARHKSVKISVEQLDQGPQKPSLPHDCLEIETGKSALPTKDTSKLTKMVKYILDIQAAHPDKVAMVQMGSFYEFIDRQAEEMVALLGIRFTRTIAGRKMAGFPLSQQENYVKKLVQEHKKTVLVLDQIDDLTDAGSNEAKKRPVSRIISPGTLVGESFINGHENNYVAAIHFTNSHLEETNPSPDSPVAVAWFDVSVGSQVFFQLTKLGDLMTAIARINPREIILDNAAKNLVSGEWYSDLADLRQFAVSYRRFPSSTSFVEYSTKMFFQPELASYTVRTADEKELSAVCALLAHLTENLPGSSIKFTGLEKYTEKEFMHLDPTSRSALELTRSHNGDTVKGTLLNVIKRTSTQSGARLLDSWLTSPRTSIADITRRQNLVSYFIQQRVLRNDLTDIMKNMDDCQRSIRKMSMRNFSSSALVELAKSIITMSDVQKRLGRESDQILIEWKLTLEKCLEKPLELVRRIQDSIDFDALEAPAETSEDDPQPETPTAKKTRLDVAEFRSVLKETASPALERLCKKQREFIADMYELENEFKRLHTGDPVKISLKWTPQLGYHVHVQSKSSPPPLIRIEGQQLKQTKRTLVVHNDQWTNLGIQRDKIQEKRARVELAIMRELRDSALDVTGLLNECCFVIDQIDVAISFAELAEEQQLVRPVLTDATELSIEGGRHLTVDVGLQSAGVSFTANDCILGGQEKKIWMVTGPNMGGKSTFIRQVAIITILAQVGCFVPANRATIGIVDRIFCRIGAGDDLFRGRSTFMIEMLETGTILKRATERSLAILDEVGRGTGTNDGLAIAYATILHLLDINKCRTLFATHFGNELASLLDRENRRHDISYYKTSIDEITPNTVRYEGEFSFDHKLRKGICDNSQGLKIAALGGFPPLALKNAQAAWSLLAKEP
jgi:DNA mismatch repair ATPase MutS